MAGTKQRAVEETYVVGITRWLFGIFVFCSLLVIFYLNITDERELKLLTNQFPEFSSAVKNTIIHTYKVGMSIFILVTDIILVGPFAYLSYFSEHIKPRAGKFVNSVSFFDLGILIALIFTVSLGFLHFIIFNSISPQPREVNVNAIVIFTVAAFIGWVFLMFAKIYSYTREQRKELSKYAIRF